MLEKWKAIVLCGGQGYRLRPLTNAMPKCMLPVMGIPLFWYQLKFLERNSCEEVILVSTMDSLLLIQKCMNEHDQVPQLPNLSINFVALPDRDSYWSTIEILRYLAPQIDRDFIVISGDFVSNLDLSKVLCFHHVMNSDITCLLARRFISVFPIPKIMKPKERDIVGITATNQLLFMNREDDVDESIFLHPGMLSKYGNVRFTAEFDDCRVYFIKKKLLSHILDMKSDSSLKDDFIPFILKQQYEESYGDIDLIAKKTMYCNTTKFKNFSEKNSSKSGGTCFASLRCFAYTVSPDPNVFVAHCNDIPTYFEANKMIGKTAIFDSFPHSCELTQLNSSSSYIVQPISVPGTISKKNERPYIKRSVICRNCKLGIAVRIINSLIMEECVIKDRAEITNSIIFKGVEVGEGAHITSSIIIHPKIEAKASILERVMESPKVWIN